MTVSTEELNTARFLEHLDRCVNGRDYDAMPEYYAATYRTVAGCAGQGPATGPAEEIAQLKAMVDAFPDFRYEVESLIADGDTLAVTARFRGHHRGEFLGIPATGRAVDVPFVDLLRFEGGMMVEYWGVFDTNGLRRQLEPTSSPL